MKNEDVIDDAAWDSQVENDSDGFVVLEDGTEADCTILEFTPAMSKAGSPMASLRIECVAPQGRTIVEENLVVGQENCEWKLCEFFKAIGWRKHGQRIVINRKTWDLVVGASFRATLVKEPWRSNPNRFSNKIKKYLEPVTPAAGEEVSFG